MKHAAEKTEMVSLSAQESVGQNVTWEAGAFGRWALLLAGARRHSRAGRAADGATEENAAVDEAADAGGGVEGEDAVFAARED